MGKTYILNPTPLVLIGNPRKKKRVKTNKSKSHGGEKEMSRKRHHVKKVVKNARKHRRSTAKSNPKRHRSVKVNARRRRTVKVNTRRRRTVAKSNPRHRRHYAKNPIVVRTHRRRRVKHNPDLMKTGLEGLKLGGLVTVGMIGTALIPQYALAAMNVKNEGIAKYGSEIVVGAALAWASKVFKQDFEIPVLAGAVAVILIQGLGDVISGIGGNMKIAGYGYLPAEQAMQAYPAIGAGNYGQFVPQANVNSVANGVYA